MKYKVLWFDDKYETLELIQEEALLNNIELIGYTNADDGLVELEKNIEFFDAVIVDGLFYSKREHTGDTLSDDAFSKVARALDKLENRKKIPWFILSGQQSFTKEKNPLAHAFKDNKVYDKNRPEDVAVLWADVKKAADKQADTQLRHKYRKVFEVCTGEYIGSDAAKHLLILLKKEIAIDEFLDDDLYFNPLRKIMEDFFKACKQYGILPGAFINGDSVSLNESGRFFSGSQEKGYQIVAPGFPGKIVADNINAILMICQPASHRGEVDRFLKKVNCPYLLLSVTYQLLNVLVWFKYFVDENPDKEINRRLWTDISYEGEIEFDGQNYFIADCVIQKNKVEGFCRPGDKIKITKYSENTNYRLKQYKYFASSFEKLKN